MELTVNLHVKEAPRRLNFHERTPKISAIGGCRKKREKVTAKHIDWEKCKHWITKVNRKC